MQCRIEAFDCRKTVLSIHINKYEVLERNFIEDRRYSDRKYMLLNDNQVKVF